MSDAVERKVGQRITALRHAAGLTQEELAEKAGLATVSISRLERGVTIPSLATLARVGKSLGARMPELFDDTQPRSEKERAIDNLSARLKQRSPSEVKLVCELAKAVFRASSVKATR